MRLKSETQINITEWHMMPEDVRNNAKRKVICHMVNNMPIDFLDQIFNIKVLDPSGISDAIIEAEQMGFTEEQYYSLKRELFELGRLGLVKIKASI